MAVRRPLVGVGEPRPTQKKRKQRGAIQSGASPTPLHRLPVHRKALALAERPELLEYPRLVPEAFLDRLDEDLHVRADRADAEVHLQEGLGEALLRLEERLAPRLRFELRAV